MIIESNLILAHISISTLRRPWAFLFLRSNKAQKGENAKSFPQLPFFPVPIHFDLRLEERELRISSDKLFVFFFEPISDFRAPAANSFVSEGETSPIVTRKRFFTDDAWVGIRPCDELAKYKITSNNHLLSDLGEWSELPGRNVLRFQKKWNLNNISSYINTHQYFPIVRDCC